MLYSKKSADAFVVIDESKFCHKRTEFHQSAAIKALGLLFSDIRVVYGGIWFSLKYWTFETFIPLTLTQNVYLVLCYRTMYCHPDVN